MKDRNFAFSKCCEYAGCDKYADFIAKAMGMLHMPSKDTYMCTQSGMPAEEAASATFRKETPVQIST